MSTFGRLKTAVTERWHRLEKRWWNTTAEPAGGSSPAIRSLVVAGLAVLLLFFGVIVGWAGTAPITRAALAPGYVVVDGNRKTVQHLEGGIVARLAVREGERVEEGQVLIELDRTQARATLRAIDGEQIAAQALEARLSAERRGADAIDLPEELAHRLDEPLVAQAIAGQRDLFVSRKRAWEEQGAIRLRQKARLADQVTGLEAELAALRRQQTIIESQRLGLVDAVERGSVARARLYQLEGDEAELEAGIAHAVAAIAETRRSMVEIDLIAAETAAQRDDEIIQGLRDVQQSLEDADSRMSAARDVLARKTIRAPIAGTVVGLQVFTEGGVVAPGAAILDLVPADGRLVVEARLDPGDRDSVAPGQTARLRFLAFNQRLIDRVEGRVLSISADRLLDDRSGLPFYRALIEITGDVARALGGAEIYPGMQVQTMIVTGERSALGYLLRPILQNIERAMLED